MNGAALPWRPGLPAGVILGSVAALAVVLGSIGSLGLVLGGVVVGIGGVAISGALGLDPRGRFRAFALLPVLAALGILAFAAPPGPVGELLAGAGGVAVLAWLSADPHRPSRGLQRGALGWALPGLAVGLAWAGSFLLPPSAAPLGVAGGLVAGAVIALAVLFRRPELAESAPTI